MQAFLVESGPLMMRLPVHGDCEEIWIMSKWVITDHLHVSQLKPDTNKPYELPV